MTVAYHGTVALDAVSVAFPARAVTGIIGPNGAGKTTLLHAIMGMQPWQRGSITDFAVPAEQRGNQTETNYGFLGGINGDFPITRRTGFIAELTYHWINYDYKVRYLTLGGGLRFSF